MNRDAGQISELVSDQKVSTRRRYTLVDATMLDHMFVAIYRRYLSLYLAGVDKVKVLNGWPLDQKYQ